MYMSINSSGTTVSADTAKCYELMKMIADVDINSIEKSFQDFIASARDIILAFALVKKNTCMTPTVKLHFRAERAGLH